MGFTAALHRNVSSVSPFAPTIRANARTRMSLQWRSYLGRNLLSQNFLLGFQQTAYRKNSKEVKGEETHHINIIL